MKPLTAALLLSFALTGAACSDSVKSTAEAAPPASSEEPLPIDTSTATSETALGGTLNLNIGGQRETEGTRLLGAGGLGNGSGQGSTLIGSGGLGGGNFGEAPDLGIRLELEEDDAASILNAPSDAQPPADEDEIVRLPN